MLFIDHPVARPRHGLNKIHQFFTRLKSAVPSLDVPVSLNKDAVWSVDHDLGNAFIVDQVLQYIESADRGKQLPADPHTLAKCQPRLPVVIQYQGVDDLPDHGVVRIGPLIQFFHELCLQYPVTIPVHPCPSRKKEYENE